MRPDIDTTEKRLAILEFVVSTFSSGSSALRWAQDYEAALVENVTRNDLQTPLPANESSPERTVVQYMSKVFNSLPDEVVQRMRSGDIGDCVKLCLWHRPGVSAVQAKRIVTAIRTFGVTWEALIDGE